MATPDYLQRVYELIRCSEEQGYAPCTASHLEEAARIAEKHHDIPHALLARYLFVGASAPIHPRKALVAFSWCLQHLDEGDPVVPKAALVQLYGVAVGILRSDPVYTLEQIETTFREMEALYQEVGLPDRDLAHQRIYGAIGVGDREAARRWFTQWTTMDPGPSHCDSCELGTRVLFHLYEERWEKGIELAQPILCGDVSCDEGQPLMTLAAVLVPMLRLGKFEEARRCYLHSRQLLTSISYAGIWAAGRQLAYLVLVGEEDQAAEVFERFFPTAYLMGTPMDRYGFYLSVRLYFRWLASRRSFVDLQMPLPFPIEPTDDGFSTGELHKWIHAETAALGHAFDRRNQNSEYTRIATEFDKIYEQLISDSLPH